MNGNIIPFHLRSNHFGLALKDKKGQNDQTNMFNFNLDNAFRQKNKQNFHIRLQIQSYKTPPNNRGTNTLNRFKGKMPLKWPCMLVPLKINETNK